MPLHIAWMTRLLREGFKSSFQVCCLSGEFEFGVQTMTEADEKERSFTEGVDMLKRMMWNVMADLFQDTDQVIQELPYMRLRLPQDFEKYMNSESHPRMMRLFSSFLREWHSMQHYAPRRRRIHYITLRRTADQHAYLRTVLLFGVVWQFASTDSVCRRRQTERGFLLTNLSIQTQVY